MKIQVWDLSTRVFHWLLVLSFAFLVYSGKTGNLFDWHQTAGIVLLSLVVYRILWGFFGSSTSRFSQFLYSPKNVLAYAKTLFKRDSKAHVGHNPMGGLMVLVMLLVLLFEGVTGLFATDEILIEGPLYNWVSYDTSVWLTDLHHQASEIMIPLVILHILAIAFYHFYKRQNLIKPMFTGTTERDGTSEPATSMRPAIVGLILMALCYAALHFGLPMIA